MHFTTLIDSRTLEAHLEDADLVIIDCRFDLMHPDAGRSEWLASHIPNARYAHLDHDLSAPVTPATGRHPLPDVATLVARLEGWGIGNASQVVAYDAAGGGYAVRLWWMLRWLGHGRVAVLNGGLGAWCEAGLPLEKGAITPRPAKRPSRASESTRFLSQPRVWQ